jgi:hypothetical protein
MLQMWAAFSLSQKAFFFKWASVDVETHNGHCACNSCLWVLNPTRYVSINILPRRFKELGQKKKKKNQKQRRSQRLWWNAVKCFLLEMKCMPHLQPHSSCGCLSRPAQDRASQHPSTMGEGSKGPPASCGRLQLMAAGEGGSSSVEV